MDHEVDYIISITILAQALAGNGRLVLQYTVDAQLIFYFFSPNQLSFLSNDVYKHYDGTGKAKKKYLVVTQL